MNDRNRTGEEAMGSEGAAAVGYRPSLTFYHANARGTGAAVSMDLHPAHGRKGGCIMMKVANQATVGDRKAAQPTYPRFDWEHAIVAKLGFDDLCKMLQVLRGECESVEDGRGLYHVTSSATTKISFRHMLEPVAGYSLDVYRTARGGEETHAHVFFSMTEATGICEAVAGSMSLICFGLPVVLPHDTSAYEAREREARNVRAA